ncbi:nuclear transport factor 2 family protein [Novosphingobium olei]|uniref:nuclear transport factor 2 family protein n=1 Tax=Novosphingobium olei TaxID=2728851 RepID=UPI003087C7CF|nr:nuclear transport factor 2 family protein [Novosphingobium olei]
MIVRRAALPLLALLALASAPAVARSGRGETERNRAIVTSFAHRFYDLRDVRGAFERYVAPDYIQHNPGILDGRSAAIDALAPMFGAEGSRFEIKRIIVDGDMAVIHLHGRTGAQGNGGSVADIYRLKDGKIVEHWDVLQPIADHTVNPHPYF